MSQILITFEGVEEWEEKRETVDNILEKYTGTAEYPSTRSLPPMIFGAELEDDAIAELKALEGVVVKSADYE